MAKSEQELTLDQLVNEIWKLGRVVITKELTRETLDDIDLMKMLAMKWIALEEQKVNE